MLSIKDPTLKRLLLEHLIEQLDQDETALAALIGAGCDPELIEVLRHRAARDIVRAARMDAMLMHVTFNAREVIGCFTRLDAIKRDAELQEYLVAHGASNEMLMQLYRMDKREVIRLRTLVLPGAAGFSGRPPMPAMSAREAIHNTWAKIGQMYTEESLAWRIRRLHETHPQWFIHTLWATVHEFDGDNSTAQESTRSRTR